MDFLNKIVEFMTVGLAQSPAAKDPDGNEIKTVRSQQTLEKSSEVCIMCNYLILHFSNKVYISALLHGIFCNFKIIFYILVYHLYLN